MHKEGTWNPDYSDCDGTISPTEASPQVTHVNFPWLCPLCFEGANIFSILKWICWVSWLKKLSMSCAILCAWALSICLMSHLVWWFFALLYHYHFVAIYKAGHKYKLSAFLMLYCILSNSFLLKFTCNQLLRTYMIFFSSFSYVILSRDTTLCWIWKIDYPHVSHICLCFIY
jgi:hypothetical protein